MTHMDIDIYDASLHTGFKRITIVPVTFWGRCHTKYTIHLNLMRAYQLSGSKWVQAQ